MIKTTFWIVSYQFPYAYKVTVIQDPKGKVKSLECLEADLNVD
jgi:hypothetical protein